MTDLPGDRRVEIARVIDCLSRDQPCADAGTHIPRSPVLSDPMEKIIQAALESADIAYTTDVGGGNPVGLDFYLPDHDLHIEVKQFHTPRIAEQMARAPNVIAVQGVVAAKWIAALIDRGHLP